MVNFARPPINEVVVGKVFVQRPDFLVPYYGAFWDKLRDQYPKTSHAVPIVALGQGQLVAQEEFINLMLPRVWFLTEDSTRLIQLQQDRLHANWRQTAPDTPYVRFPAVHDEFWRVSGLLDQLLTEVHAEPLVDTHLEVSYINIIPSEGVWESAADWGRVFRDFAWHSTAERVVPNPGKYAIQYECPAFMDDTRLVVKIGTATRGSDPQPVIRFELTVNGKVSEGLDERAWFRQAHDLIVTAFKDLTTPRMHEVWGLIDG